MFTWGYGIVAQLKASCSCATVPENLGEPPRILVRAESSAVIWIPVTAFLESLKSHINLNPAARSKVTASSQAGSVLKERDKAASGSSERRRRKEVAAAAEGGSSGAPELRSSFPVERHRHEENGR